MSWLRLLISVLVTAALFASCAAESEPPATVTAAAVDPVTAVNPIRGEGLPNPNPTRIGNWGDTARGTGVGFHRRPRHRPDGRTCLGVRAVRIRLGGWTGGQLRQ